MKKTALLVLTAFLVTFCASSAMAFGNDAPAGSSYTSNNGTFNRINETVDHVSKNVSRDINNARAELGARANVAERVVRNAKMAFDNVTNPNVINSAKQNISVVANEYKQGYKEFKSNFGTVVKEQTKIYAQNIKNHATQYKNHFKENTSGITAGIGNAYQQAGGAVSSAISRTINGY